jgi:hypothetical protein
MELIVSAIMSDLLNRSLSKAIQRYRRSKAEETEHKLRRAAPDRRHGGGG